ncbi:MAG: hypothetical protein NTU86_03560 [Burkholderiales bacterium]|nr:hypothetical protein [Burkholderiales bacterium]
MRRSVTASSEATRQFKHSEVMDRRASLAMTEKMFAMTEKMFAMTEKMFAMTEKMFAMTRVVLGEDRGSNCLEL